MFGLNKMTWMHKRRRNEGMSVIHEQVPVEYTGLQSSDLTCNVSTVEQ